jgi:hypothetical protein
MKFVFKCLAVLSVLSLSIAPGLVRAQDAPPPPPPDQMGQDQQAPPPDQGPGAPPDQSAPPDQGAPTDQDDQGASFQNFYDQLGSQGTWVQTDNYGYAFQPTVTDPNWAPYTDGHWVYTEDGWTWVSDEPWGWATYHYGRWANIDGTGWVWIPGYRWAPAWVSWRYGGGYAGWAPLPPETLYGAEYADPGVAIGIGFHFGGDVDVSFNIGPGCYNFVRVGDMGYPNYRGHYLDRSNNYTVINHTTNVTNIVINNRGGGTNFQGVTLHGPPIAQVNAQSHQHIQTLQLTSANQPGVGRVNGNSLAVYAPRVNGASARTARPASVSQTIANPTFNRGDSISRPLAVNSTLAPAAPSAAAIEAARAAQASAPAKARIATENTPVRTTATRPLTAMTPVSQLARANPATHPVNAPVEHTTAASPFTGEPGTPKTEANPASTYHPQAVVNPATTYHPQSEAAPAPTYHPQAETTPAPTYHPQEEIKPPTEEKPAENYHPQAEVKPPTETYHPESEQRAPPAEETHPAESQIENFHSASPPVHEEAPVSHAPAPVSHPAPAAAPSGGGKPAPAPAKDDKNH